MKIIFLPNGAADDTGVPKLEPNVGAVVPVAGVPNVDPNAGSCAFVCPNPDPNPPKPVVVVDVVVPKAVPKPVAEMLTC